jgi:xanthine dehydrogenase YagS FAD-binding subunit
MLSFDYTRASDSAGAIALGRRPDSRFLGGGTNLVDLMREDIEKPRHLIDVTQFSTAISATEDGGILIGAGTKNTAIAEHHIIRTRYPLLSRAILAGASAQVRNMATAAGNLLQRTRCHYFFDRHAHCNKRAPGSGCDALQGFNRMHAIIGGSPSCVATHPSDMCVALTALDAIIHIDGPGGTKAIAMGDLHRLPEDRPDIETVLGPGDLITAIELPVSAASPNAIYRKVRDRASYAFALVSIAARLDVDRGKIASVRLAFGGVAPKPWRASLAERALLGGPATAKAFDAAADLELAAARPLRDNAFKIDLTKRVMTAALQELASGGRS